MAEDARADVDFYTLISVSSAIALFGLLLDSSAVIIGAMLVAPLMSPILSLAQGIVAGEPSPYSAGGCVDIQGNRRFDRGQHRRDPAVARGSADGEILARVRPNLLDLGVALAAGAAAAYAVSRKSVAAALPGVAISVALVPPLCVVGLRSRHLEVRHRGRRPAAVLDQSGRHRPGGRRGLLDDGISAHPRRAWSASS